MTGSKQSAPEVAGPIAAEAIALARALRWIPQDFNDLLRDLYPLTDYQRGWFISLYAACATSPIPGYLRVSAHSLWKVVGAHSERSWAVRSAAVLAAFQFAEIDGEKYLYHPRLVSVLATQVEKLHKRRLKSEESTGPPFSTGGAQLPLLYLSLVERKKTPQGKTAARSVASEELNHEQIDPNIRRIAERIAKLRRQGNGAR